MHNAMFAKWNRWLLPAVLILFILQVVMLPWAIGFTWADRSDTPRQVLTYTQNKLTWDSATTIRADGTAVMHLFSHEYDGTVLSGNGDKVVAPGTDEALYVRLKNSVRGTISYTAVLYRINSDARLPVEAVLSGTGFTDTASYSLPSGVTDGQVVRAVEGTVSGGNIQDFDVSWLWSYYENDAQDVVDTTLGNSDPLGDVTVGLYIVVEDNNSYVTPDIPQTGDESNVGWYLCLMVISFIMLVLLLWDRRREAKRESF